MAKLEAFNPTGSVKDRAALAMVEDAEKRGVLFSGANLVEPTSGNFGVSLAALGAERGYRVTVVMPDTFSKERQALIRAYGGELVLTEGKEGMRGAVERASELQRERGAVLLGQFENPANPAAHQKTGEEIWADAGKVDVFVAGVGTGGTVTGAGGFLKQKNPAVRIVAVEPKGSPYLSEGRAGAHKIQGIGAGFAPAVLERSLLDEICTVTDGQAFSFCRLLAKTEGIFAGLSSGAALCAAVRVAKREEYAGKNVAVLFPDSGERYLSLMP